MRKIEKKILRLFIITALLSIYSFQFPMSDNLKKWENRFYEGKFSEYTKFLQEKKGKSLSLNEKLFLAEALIRSGNTLKATEFINKLKNYKLILPEYLAVKAILYIAEGKLFKAKVVLDKAYELNKNSLRIFRGKLIYLLFLRDFKRANSLLLEINNKFKKFSTSGLYNKIGLEIYRYHQDINGLSTIYKSMVKIIRKKSGKSAVKNIKETAKLFKGKNIKSFFLESESDSVSIPLLEDNNGHLNMIKVKIGDKKYRVIIDTGNMTGWIIHNRDLREYLKPKKGGRIITKIGSESENLDGFSIYCKSLNLGDLSIKNLYGIYIPKPYSSFYDANLNPIYIRNRIISLDMIKRKVFFRTKERFMEYLEKNSKTEVFETRWFGNRYPLLPVIISGVNTFAILETGAEDISLREDFAKKIKSFLIPKSKFLSNGKKFNYFLSSAKIQMGKYIFVRKNAQVWPLKKYLNDFNGFSADAVIGPDAFKDKFVISFLPEDNKIVFEYEKRKI